MNNPSKQVVFFAIGFETTAPANAIAILKAEHLNINNFFELVSQFRVPPDMATILKSEDCGIDGFLAAGHVNTVMGYHEYESISQKYAVPIVVSGFEPVDLIYAIYLLVQSLEQGKVGVSNAYKRAVSREGNVIAQKTLNRVFKISDQDWRGIGCIKNSGLAINSNYERYDAQIAFGVSGMITTENEQCISGQILSGRKKPHECEHFAISCKPDRPLGATMVSVEGACSAYYRYHR